jgi:uncharacterized protein
MELERASYLEIELDICPACAGIWFDEGELRRLQQIGTDQLPSLDRKHVPQIFKSSDEAGSRRCPSCQSVLKPHRYMYATQIVLDGCDSCHGVWVQDGELDLIHQAVSGGVNSDLGSCTTTHAAVAARRHKLMSWFRVRRASDSETVSP